MSILIAALHIIGSFIAQIAFGYVYALISQWELARNAKKAYEETSIALGIPVDRLDDPENATKVVLHNSARFSSDRFQNRMSDLCGWIRDGWMVLGLIVQIVTAGTVLWYTFTESASNAVYAWWILGIAIFFWVVAVSFAFLCKLLTGRYPGQARLARKVLAAYIEHHKDELP